MNRLIAIIVFLILSFNSKADYRPLELYEMIIKAEKIVYGTIVELDSSTFTLKIEGSLTSDSGTITVERFQDWMCASRWTEYKIGQRLFLFLTTWNGKLVSMSGGNEGELPLDNNSVYIHGSSIPTPLPPPPNGMKLRKPNLYFVADHHNIYSGDYFGIEWHLSDFIHTVSLIRTCFDFTYGSHRERTNWRIKCEVNELERKASESKLVKWVYGEATEENER